MTRVDLNFRRLECFLVVAEELHFGRAAERLSMAQPPLSRQIARLEEEVEAELFDRSRNQIRLTQAGEELMSRTRRLLTEAEDMRLAVRHYGQGAYGRLRIGFVASAMYGAVAQSVKAFRADYPDVNLCLQPMSNVALKTALIQRRIDVAFTRPGIDDPELKSVRLMDESLVLALPEGHPHAGASSLALSSLSQETFILYPERPRPSYADRVLSICSQHGFQPPENLFVMDCQTALGLVAIGAGVAVVPGSVVDSPGKGLRYVGIEGPNPGTSLFLTQRRDVRTPVLCNFRQIAEVTCQPSLPQTEACRARASIK